MTSPSELVVLIEPEAGGHHFVPYAIALARALREVDVPVALLTTPAARAHPAMGEFQRCVGEGISIHSMPGISSVVGGSVPSLVHAQANYWRAVREGWRTISSTSKPGLGVVLGLDSVDRAIAFAGSPLGGSPFVGLTIQTKYHWPVLGIGPGGRLAIANRWSFRRVLARRDCLGIATIDEALSEFEALHGSHPDKVRFVPDPGEVALCIARDEARATLRIDPAVPMILAYGGLDGRKNVGALLRGAARARTEPVVVLAGMVGPEVWALSESDEWRALEGRGRLVVQDGFVPLDQEARLFGAADLAWVGYRADFHGQSSVMALAASAGVPSLGRRGGLIGRAIERHCLGETVDPLDANEVARAIDRMANARVDGVLCNSLQRFASTRSLAEHRAAWLRALSAWWPPVRKRRASQGLIANGLTGLDH